MPPPRALFNLRRRSLARGNLLVISSLFAAIYLADFPHNRATLLLIVPVGLAILGTAETVRCMRRVWDFYHVGVILCIYMDLMALTIMLFFLLYPLFFASPRA